MTLSPISRGLLFGTAAESYERFRLGYPDGVVDRTLAYAGRPGPEGRAPLPVARAIEVGAGTGKATRVFASHGLQVTALEPDPEMFAVLARETVGMPVEPRLCALEEYDGPPADLVYAAASWHWTDPATRWSRVAGMLREGGVLAIFGGPMRIADDHLQATVSAASGGRLEDPAFRAPGAAWSQTSPRWLEDEVEACPQLSDAELHLLPRHVVLPQREYIGYLSTLSAYLGLPLEERQEVLRSIADVVPAQVRVDVTVGLHLARRV